MFASAKTRALLTVARARRPPETVLAYLSRYTRRFAISNSRLIAWSAASTAVAYPESAPGTS